jgi:Permuted papain-like amidase enzyme, YaeF/YiiX, C92 family
MSPSDPVQPGATSSFRQLPPRMRVGRFLDLLGQVGLPFGFGLLGGYFASDRGVRLFPTMVQSLLLLALLCLVSVLVGRALLGKHYEHTELGRRIRLRVVIAMVSAAAVLAALLFNHNLADPTPLTDLTAPQFDRAFALDAAQYRELDDGIEAQVARVEAMELGQARVLTPGEEAALLDAWAAVWNSSVALDQVRDFYEDWYRFDPSRHDRPRHLRSFLLTFAAELALYEKSARLARVVLENDDAKKFLDAPHPDQGLPPASFSRMRNLLQGSEDQARVVAGHQYLRVLDVGFAGRTESATLGVGWLWDRVLNHLQVVEALGLVDRAALQLRSDGQLFKRTLHRAWYPTQKGVAEKMGDARVRRVGTYLITEEQMAEMDPDLAPGDILVSRKNWYLSNIGLPGFWPHGLIYIGSPDKFRAWADDTAVRAWVKEQSGRDEGLDDYLARRFPADWLRYTAGPPVVEGEAPHEYVVIEAISDGVVFNSMPHAAGDYLGAVRPKLDKVGIARSLVEAFTHLGKPYDFNFDFATDHALVCTELVWRSYRTGDEGAGVDIPLVDMAGRRTLPANDLVRFIAEQARWEQPVMDFVLFYDGIEGERRAVRSDEAAFLASWERPKWDVVQE